MCSIIQENIEKEREICTLIVGKCREKQLSHSWRRNSSILYIFFLFALYEKFEYTICMSINSSDESAEGLGL